MCKDCGCSDANSKYYHHHDHDHGHDHDHHHDHDHDHDHDHQRKIEIEMNVLQKNDEIAKKNRKWFNDNNIRVLNMISSPGSGKTRLLEKTLERARELNKNIKIKILAGDQERDFDKIRLEEKGGIVKQLNTKSSCHLDASMIAKEIGDFIDPDTDVLIIENVGNLVCPASFDLGEHQKVALISTTEGEDKPAKYPILFHNAGLVMITKIDLIPHLDWETKKCRKYIREVHPGVPILETSAKTGEGIDAWIEYLI